MTTRSPHSPHSLQELRSNPDLLESLHAQARLARSEYVQCRLRELLAALRPRPQYLRNTLRTAPCG